MRLLIATTTAAFIFSAATAAPSPTMGSGMMGSQPMMGAARLTGAGTLIIHHQVADFAKWRIAYDADQSNRTAAGLASCRVQRSLDNASDVVVSCSMADVAKARSFASSKPMAETMAKAGVIGKPQILFLTPPQ